MCSEPFLWWYVQLPCLSGARCKTRPPSFERPHRQSKTFLKRNSDCTSQLQTILMAFITVRVKSKLVEQKGRPYVIRPLPDSQHRLFSLLLMGSTSWQPRTHAHTHTHTNVFNSWLNPWDNIYIKEDHLVSGWILTSIVCVSSTKCNYELSKTYNNKSKHVEMDSPAPLSHLIPTTSS